jgi:hypothetical protein
VFFNYFLNKSNVVVFFYFKGDQIKNNGYPLETYAVETQDHYMVGLERIPYGKSGNKTIGKPILLLHGLYGTSMYYTLSNISLSK